MHEPSFKSTQVETAQGHVGPIFILQALCGDRLGGLCGSDTYTAEPVDYTKYFCASRFLLALSYSKCLQQYRDSLFTPHEIIPTLVKHSRFLFPAVAGKGPDGAVPASFPACWLAPPETCDTAVPAATGGLA